ncbi:MAG: hypothetical protein QJR13_01130 [Bacillota bacterium]|nr:hypothetical protein [Bacillota bacterium]
MAREEEGQKAGGASQEAIASALRQRAVEGRIACREALKLAEELGVPPLQVGREANRLKIKIKGCQLGCFG